MKSRFTGRAILLTLSLLGIFALVLLSTGLESLSFHEARLYQQERTEAVSGSMAALMDQIASVPMWKHIVFWIIIFFIVLMLSALFSAELRKKLLWAITRMAAITLVIVYLVKNRARFGLPDTASLSTTGIENMQIPDALPVPSFNAPIIPPALTYFVSVAFLLLTFGLIWLISRGFSAMRTRPSHDKTLDDLAAVARQSLDELATGHDWEDAIVRCYASMSDVVARRRNLQRDVSMTPDEFASHLTRSGLPATSVQRLTRLFESVRYGARAAGDRERAEASACLSEILRYCGEVA